ncbi:MAG: hypothetical protein AUK32_09785 [Candidatus Aquicultor secundus]|nr:MAG: hypothetical protein AUK32_09785 [Candidatus Aquicultor secundus]
MILASKKNRFFCRGTELVDKSLILRKLAELNLYKSQLTEFSAVTLENYKTDWKTQRIVERTLQIMIVPLQPVY